MRIVLVDDHPLFRQALAATLALAHDGVEVEQFDTLAGVRRALEDDADVAFVLLDLQLPDSHGMAGLLSLQARFPDLPVAVISANDDRETVSTAMACGAAGFVSKAASVAELTAAVKALMDGGSWLPGTHVEDDRTALSATQARVLDGIHRGLMNKQIAHELGLSEATVKYHLTGIFRKLGVQTRSQLTSLARGRFVS